MGAKIDFFDVSAKYFHDYSTAFHEKHSQAYTLQGACLVPIHILHFIINVPDRPNILCHSMPPLHGKQGIVQQLSPLTYNLR